MATISERLRAVEDGWRYLAPLEIKRRTNEAADTIDALVAALENFVNNDEYCREDYEEAQAALALARGGK